MSRRSLLMLAFVVSATGVETIAQPLPGIERVGWLQGCWEAGSPERTVEEYWMAPRGGSTIGMSRTIAGGRAVEYELILLLVQDGKLGIRRILPVTRRRSSSPSPSTMAWSCSRIWRTTFHSASATSGMVLTR